MVEAITPEQAQEWLDNRSPDMTVPLDPEKAARFARTIKDGDWNPDEGRPIRIRNGQLRNGQHRLTAIVEANETVEMRVTRHKVTY